MCAQIPAARSPGHRGDWVLFYGAQYFWIYSMQYGSCRPSGGLNCEMAHRFLENVCIVEFVYLTDIKSLPEFSINC